MNAFAVILVRQTESQENNKNIKGTYHTKDPRSVQRKRSKSQFVPIALVQEYTALETLGLSGKYMISYFLEKVALLTALTLKHEWRNLQFKVDSQRQIFEKQFYLFSEFLQEIC